MAPLRLRETYTILSAAYQLQTVSGFITPTLSRCSNQRTSAKTGGTLALGMVAGGDERYVSRKDFLSSVVIAGAVTLGAVFRGPEPASANGMLDFPPARLNNRYFLIRSGQGGSDEEGVIQSHPIGKLHADNGLTEKGVQEAQRAADVLRTLGVDNAFIWADISSRAQETARILAHELDIRQERLVPEYAYLEPRGMGIFDGQETAAVLPQIYKADAKDTQWRPPPNTDGTPNESAEDVFVRVRQLMSKLETQYQGENLVIVSPDSDCLSVLQAFVLGEELGTHSRYYLRPGEGRQLRISSETEYNFGARSSSSRRVREDFASVGDVEIAAAKQSEAGSV